METSRISSLINNREGNFAFLLGNSLNRLCDEVNTWDNLIHDLWLRFTGKKLSEFPEIVCPLKSFENKRQIVGTSYPELFDIIANSFEYRINNYTNEFDRPKLNKLITSGCLFDHSEVFTKLQSMALSEAPSFSINTQDFVKSKAIENFKNVFNEFAKSGNEKLLSFISEYGVLYPNLIRQNLLRYVADKISQWKFYPKHKGFASFCRQNKVPILTTNYDKLLENSIETSIFCISDEFDEKHPWSTYYAEKELLDVTSDFGIWHIQGIIDMPISIKLGLSHYMESVEFARSILHSNNEYNIDAFKKTRNSSKYTNSWLKIFLENNLIIVGLSLTENETFLRWLLIQRFRFQKLFHMDNNKAFFITADTPNIGQECFLRSCNIDIVKVETYDDVFNNFRL